MGVKTNLLKGAGVIILLLIGIGVASAQLTHSPYVWGHPWGPRWRGCGCGCCYHHGAYYYTSIDTTSLKSILASLKKGAPFKNPVGELRIPLIDTNGYIRGMLFEDVNIRDLNIVNVRPHSADLTYKDRIVGIIHF